MAKNKSCLHYRTVTIGHNRLSVNCQLSATLAFLNTSSYFFSCSDHLPYMPIYFHISFPHNLKAYCLFHCSVISSPFLLQACAFCIWRLLHASTPQTMGLFFVRVLDSLTAVFSKALPGAWFMGSHAFLPANNRYLHGPGSISQYVPVKTENMMYTRISWCWVTSTFTDTNDFACRLTWGTSKSQCQHYSETLQSPLFQN